MGSVILPSLTDQMVLGVFKFLVEAELRKSITGQQEFRYGCQTGAVTMMVLMFGSSQLVASRWLTAHTKKQTWLYIVEEIRETLQTWTELLSEAEVHDEIDFEGLQDAVDKAVNDYALQHPKKLGDALRVNL